MAPPDLEREFGSVLPGVSSCDDCYTSVSLPFAFPFYGSQYQSVDVSSNGLITFSRRDVTFTNSISALQQRTAIAVLWDDWNLACAVGDVWYRAYEDRVVITWDKVVHITGACSASATTTFQAVLHADGRIRLNYGASAATVSATLGISQGNAAFLSAFDVTATNLMQSYLFIPVRPNTPPVVTLASVASPTRTPTLALSMNVADAERNVASVRVYRDGVLVASPSLDASGNAVAWVTLVEGHNSLRVDAVDTHGGTGSASVTVVHDVTQPALALEDPPALTRSADVAYRGTVADPNGIAELSVTLGSTTQQLVIDATTGAFTVTLPLKEGVNELLFVARDQAGNSTSQLVPVRLDTLSPVLAIVTPGGAAVSGSASVDLTFTVQDGSSSVATLLVNGAEHSTRAVARDGSPTTVALSLSEGLNHLAVSVQDEAGNPATVQSVDVLVDLTLPVVALEQAFGAAPLVAGQRLGPQPGHQLLYNFRVDDLAGTTTVVPDGTSAELPRGGGVLTGAILLQEGWNTFRFVTTDEAGHDVTLSRTVLYDVTPPAGEVAVPVAGATVSGTVELAAFATDNLTGTASAAFRIDEGPALPALPDEGGGFVTSIDTAQLADGPHSLTVTFVDGVGNPATESVSFVVDNTAPVVSVDPLPAYVRSVITLGATASDATAGVSAITLKVNNIELKTCSGSHLGACSVELDTTTLLDGPITVTVVATDDASNAAQAQASSILDNTPAGPFLVSPVAGAVVTRSLPLTVDVDDPNFAAVECSLDGTSLGVSPGAKSSQEVSLQRTLDGPLTVACTAADLAGNTRTQAATVVVDNWSEVLVPRVLTLRSRAFDLPVLMWVRGVNADMLTPVAQRDLQLVVPGGQPIPAVAGLAFPDLTRVFHPDRPQVFEVLVMFDRARLVASIRAGIAAGLINSAAPVRVTLYSGARPVGDDTLRVVR